MNKDFWQTVNRWLDIASLDDIDTKQQKVRQLLGQFSDPDMQSAIRRVLRCMDDERRARAELAALMPLAS